MQYKSTVDIVEKCYTFFWRQLSYAIYNMNDTVAWNKHYDEDYYIT